MPGYDEDGRFCKYMTEHELKMTRLASNLGVGAKLISYIATKMSDDEVYKYYFGNLSPIDASLFEDGMLEWYHVTMAKCDYTLRKRRQMTLEEFDCFKRKFKLLQDNGILYFDIHASNIMYGTNSNDEMEIFIIDYGHACLRSEVEHNPSVVPDWYEENNYDLDLRRYAECQILPHCQEELYTGYRNLWGE